MLLKLFGLKEAERIKVSDYHLEFYGIEKDRSIKEDTNKLDESIEFSDGFLNKRRSDENE